MVSASAVLVALSAAAGARAGISRVFQGDVSCQAQVGGPFAGQRWCGSTSPRSTTRSWDGVPVDVNVAFPPVPATGADARYPVVMTFPGLAGAKLPFADSAFQRWITKGYAVFSMTPRGERQSCGKPDAIAADPVGCAGGYVRLMDTRYEVRDAQYLAGRLADEGLIDPQRIGATGGSYGGGMSMALGALNDRVMLPDGSLVRWRSPNGTPMRIAAAEPNTNWTDLPSALVPNGSTLDYAIARSGDAYTGRIGVMKQSFVDNFYRSLVNAGNLAAPGSDPSADLTGWYGLLNAGEPYDTQPRGEGDGGRALALPLGLRHRRLDAAGTDAALQRVDRRRLPSGRGDPLLQQDPGAASELADLT